MRNLTLTKMTGAGNDFLVWNESYFTPENFFNFFNVTSRPELTKVLCNRHFGIGADGLVILSTLTDSIKWDFYNADGSSAEMCGNASRCAARYAYDKKLIQSSKFEIQTLAGSVFAEVLNEQVCVQMTKIENAKLKQKLKLAHQEFQFDFINSGVPHVVLKKDEFILNDILKTLCKEIQDNPLFAPNGTNVTLYKVISNGHIESISFERGVEDFTLACGTGAVAAAYSYKQMHSNLDEVEVKVPGGNLIVNFKKEDVFMTGPAHYIADIEYCYKKDEE